jgi:hypothetical protein
LGQDDLGTVRVTFLSSSFQSNYPVPKIILSYNHLASSSLFG